MSPPNGVAFRIQMTQYTTVIMERRAYRRFNDIIHGYRGQTTFLGFYPHILARDGSIFRASTNYAVLARMIQPVFILPASNCYWFFLFNPLHKLTPLNALVSFYRWNNSKAKVLRLPVNNRTFIVFSSILLSCEKDAVVDSEHFEKGLWHSRYFRHVRHAYLFTLKTSLSDYRQQPQIIFKGQLQAVR